MITFRAGCNHKPCVDMGNDPQKGEWRTVVVHCGWVFVVVAVAV